MCIKALECAEKNENLEVWGDGSQGRAFVHAKDVVNAIILSFKKGENEGVIQIGPSKCTKINEIANLLISKINKNITLKHDLSKPVGDIGRCANYEKARSIIGWEPKVSLEEGISDLIEWLKLKSF